MTAARLSRNRYVPTHGPNGPNGTPSYADQENIGNNPTAKEREKNIEVTMARLLQREGRS